MNISRYFRENKEKYGASKAIIKVFQYSLQ